MTIAEKNGAWMTAEQIGSALAEAGFCGVEVEAGKAYARVTPQAPEFRAEPDPDAWRLVLPWNVCPPEAAVAEWNARPGPARIEMILGEAALVMAFSAETLPQWASLASEAEAHFIRWRRARRPAEGM